jgi:cellulose synthase/poly-beta-1,6-N-acetylglucosamine synthase-like glycosyltransferase
MSVPTLGQHIYVYPTTVTAPVGSYQTVTAVVTAVNNKTVTWTADGGTIVGTNPCVANEPCTVALHVTSVGTYHLTATSNANGSVAATSTITVTASPTVTTGHPRLLFTSSDIAGLRAKATSDNPLYVAVKGEAVQWINSLNAGSTWSWTCQGGTGNPNYTVGFNQSPTLDIARQFAFMSMIDPSDATYNWGCYAHDMYMAYANWMAGLTSVGAIITAPNFNGNMLSDEDVDWVQTPDWLMAGGYLSSAEKTTVRTAFSNLAKYYTTHQVSFPPFATSNYNSPYQIAGLSAERDMGNNYIHSEFLSTIAIALTFDDNTGDDPALTNSCSATRYQVCSDGTAGSLHAYFTPVVGSGAYRYWAALEPPTVVQPAYNAAYGNFPALATGYCGYYSAVWTTCMGEQRGGESAEGSWYFYSYFKARMGWDEIRTAGYNDPLLYGPQMSAATSSWWDLKTVMDLEFLTRPAPWMGALGWEPYEFITTGDSLDTVRATTDFTTQALMLLSDSRSGITDRKNRLLWPLAVSPRDGPGYWSGYQNYHFDPNMELFAALPAGDPSYPSTDPRPGLPLDVFVGGQNQHILARSSWTDNTNTVFSYWDGNALTDHDHTFNGRFDVLSKGEWITKGRTEFNNYDNTLTSSEHSNEAGYQNITGSNCGTDACLWYNAALSGGQWFESQEATVNSPLNYSILPGYVAASTNTLGVYNANAGSTFSDYNDVTQASRSLVYLRGNNQIVYYDRGTTNHAAFKRVYLTSTGPITITGTQASWPTRSNTQKAYVTSLLPAGATISDLGAYCTVDQSCAQNNGDVDPYSHLKIEAASNPLSANFLTVLEWGASSFTKSTTGLVQSSAGQAFDGAVIGSSLVMFSQNYPVSFTGTTFPASGATTIYVSDLSPNTSYAVTGAGTPGTVTSDSAGVLTFAAAGTGNIKVTRMSRLSTLPMANRSGERQTVKIVFWLSLIGILYTYAGYPLIIWMLARFLPRPWKVAPIAPGVSVVLAVHNGVTLLAGKIQHLLGLDYPDIREIIIVSDGSTDGTGELLADQKHPRLHAIILPEHGGKAVAVNAGVAQTTAEVVLFVDIRPEIGPGAIQQLVSNFADERVGCVSGNLKLRNQGHDPASAAVGDFYWRYEQWLRTCEAVTDSPVGVYGGFYAVRRELYVQQPAGIILDDMFQPLSIIRQGFRSVVDPSAFVYDTWPKKSGDEFQRKIRTLAGNFQLLQLMPWTLTPGNRLVFQFVSHKVMRLVVPYLLVLLLVSSIALSAGSPGFATFAALQIVSWVLAIVGLRYRMPILDRVAAPASALLVLNAAAVAGLYRFLFTRGPLWKIWHSGKPLETAVGAAAAAGENPYRDVPRPQGLKPS